MMHWVLFKGQYYEEYHLMINDEKYAYINYSKNTHISEVIFLVPNVGQYKILTDQKTVIGSIKYVENCIKEYLNNLLEIIKSGVKIQ